MRRVGVPWFVMNPWALIVFLMFQTKVGRDGIRRRNVKMMQYFDRVSKPLFEVKGGELVSRYE